MSRAKDPKIVKESQKIFKVIKSAFIIVAILLFGITGIVAIYKATKEEKREFLESGVTQPQAAIERKIEVVLSPDYYTEIRLPCNTWFDFEYVDDFRVKLIDGREFDYTKDSYPFLGDEIPGKKLKLKSLVGRPTRVQIVLQKK